ncbi:DUF4139 domain-containing protein [Sphingomonas swuensis]|uniref:DUF4139 domain-containing protein n=1 Tax=Sphingomonas swuensis TaxID=977800 RepID=A0ABP7SBS3_9SPHN
MRLPLLLAAGLSWPAHAQVPVTSPRAERVEVTVYRDLSRGNRRLERDWLNGYALISETRTVTIPAGESELRLEGVASGIIPQSAIVGGLPQGIVERNRDALLLSAGSLIDRSLGQRVTLRRTSRATGRVTEQEAVVRTGSDGGVVLETPAGIEALRCSGLGETLTYRAVPAGLTARPTLSVRMRSRQPLTATVTLSYLATGFDWQADYVGRLSADERTLDLQAGLTLASTDDTSFIDATTQAVAGRVNREDARVPPVEAPAIRLRCWPQGTTSVVPQIAPPAPPPPSPPPPVMAAPAPVMEVGAEDIVVAGSRVMAARERLGDLQLYRIPLPVTVAANAQKQVGLIDQPAVRVTPVYRFGFAADSEEDAQDATLILRTRNRPEEGLGLPLPAGNVVILRDGASRPLLVGERAMDDRAVGEKVEFRTGVTPGVTARLTRTAQSATAARYRLLLTSDRPHPVTAEVVLGTDDDAPILGPSGRLVRRDGETLWETVIPANGSVELGYRLRR